MNTKFVVFDMDGVLIDTTSSWVWVHRTFGTDNEVAYERYMRGEIDDWQFMRSDIALWKAKKQDVTLKDIEDRLHSVKLMSGAKKTIDSLKARGIKTGIVSGGLIMQANRVKDICNIDYVAANGLETDASGRLTGEGLLNVELRYKGNAVLRMLEKAGVAPEECVAVGNGIIDVTMFQVAGKGIAFHPMEEGVRAGADVIIENGPLTRILKHIP